MLLRVYVCVLPDDASVKCRKEDLFTLRSIVWCEVSVYSPRSVALRGSGCVEWS